MWFVCIFCWENRVCGSCSFSDERPSYLSIICPGAMTYGGFSTIQSLNSKKQICVYIYIWYILIWFIIWHLSSWYSPIQLSRRSSVTAPSLAGDICGGVWVRSMNQGNLQAFFINKNRKNTSRWFRGSCPIPGAVFMEVGRRATRKIHSQG